MKKSQTAPRGWQVPSYARNRVRKLFTKYLRRDPVSTDYTLASIEAFGAHLRRTGRNELDCRKLMSAMLNEWRAVHDAEPTVTAEPPRRWQFLLSPNVEAANITAQTELRTAVCQVLTRPEIAGGLVNKPVRWLLVRFCEMIDRPAKLGDLQAEVVARFRPYLTGLGLTPHTIEARVSLLMRIWRVLHQEFPKAVAPAPAPDFRPKKKPTGRKPMERLPEPTDAEQRKRDLELFFVNVYTPRRLIGKSQTTIRKYRIIFAHLTRFLGRRPTLDDLNDETCCQFLQWRMTGKVSPHTVAGDRRSLNAISNYAARKRYIAEFLDLPKTPEPELRPEAWTLDELRRLIDHCRAQTGTVSNLPAGAWWTALHLFAIDSGERAGALLALRWEWIDRDTGHFKIPASVRKGKCKPLTGRLQQSFAVINELWRPGRECVFIEPGEFTYGAFCRRYKTLLKSGGFPHGRTYKLQRLRRTFASLIERAGGDATQALLHTSRRITERSYLDERIVDRKPSSAFIGQALGDMLSTCGEVLPADCDDALPAAEIVTTSKPQAIGGAA